MFAVDHAATALLINRRYPSARSHPFSSRSGHGARVGGAQLSRCRTNDDGRRRPQRRGYPSRRYARLTLGRHRHRRRGSGVADAREGIRPCGARPRGRHRHRVAPHSRSGDTRPRHRALAGAVHATTRPGLVRGRARRGVRCRVSSTESSVVRFQSGRPRQPTRRTSGPVRHPVRSMAAVPGPVTVNAMLRRRIVVESRSAMRDRLAC